jgi:dUTPase
MIKICLTENAVRILHHHGIGIESYLRGNSSGLDLYNMGNEVSIPPRSKWVESGENPIIIPLGLRLDLPPNFVGLVVERPGILKTGLIVRNGNIFPGNTDEIFVNFLNVGEREVQIPTGGKLPLQLTIAPCYTHFQQVQFQDYIAANSEKENQ